MTTHAIHTLLEASAIRPCLEKIPVFATGEARLTSVALERLWVKPGRHFHASYRIGVESDGDCAETLASASILRDANSDVLSDALDAPTPRSASWPTSWPAGVSTAALATPAIFVQLFPWDYRLPTLALALDPTVLESAGRLTSIGCCRLAGYWPGMRCSIRYEPAGHGDVLYGKVFPAGVLGAVANTQAAIACAADEGAVFDVPKVHACVPALNLLVTEPVHGEPFLDRLRRTDEMTECAESVAAALAAFHMLRPTAVTRRFRPEDELAVVEPWVDLIGAVFPSLRRALVESLTAVRDHIPVDDPDRACLVHRDFYDKQILVGAGRVALLDLDTACLGDGEIDVANFCAHLLLRDLQWNGAAERSRPLRASFLAAYAARGGRMDPGRARWYLASALLRLACLYALRPSWHALAPRLLEESRRALGHIG